MFMPSYTCGVQKTQRQVAGDVIQGENAITLSNVSERTARQDITVTATTLRKLPIIKSSIDH